MLPGGSEQTVLSCRRERREDGNGRLTAASAAGLDSRWEVLLSHDPERLTVAFPEFVLTRFVRGAKHYKPGWLAMGQNRVGKGSLLR